MSGLAVKLAASSPDGKWKRTEIKEGTEEKQKKS